MDVVRSNLKKMNGSIDLSSQPGSGTTVLLKLPLTLAILPVLVVGVGGEKYGIPLRCVLEIVNVHPQKVHCVEGGNFLHLRDEALPLLRLAQIIGSNNASRGEACRVVVLGVCREKDRAGGR
jgi:two-component system chemotaxis sensor kinase CheA